MLVHLHAAENIHYAKSDHIYLQNMSKLKTTLLNQEFERFIRGTSDLKKFLVCLKQHSSFKKSEELISLSSGIVVDDRVNCDSGEELGENVVKGIVGKRFADVTLKKKVPVFALATMGNTIIIDKDPVVVNLNQLFHRIACVVRSAGDLEGCLQYEFAPYPQSLFDETSGFAGEKYRTLLKSSKSCARLYNCVTEDHVRVKLTSALTREDYAKQRRLLIKDKNL
ncbi:hypothetical protein AVEN_64527-1 [Araneus ventricosus]|uniref:Uncharacterized protein n=1 Tax=Araneus ventricosus TaxID=182803 RepID=A0A4Y2GLH0_ARAVE|nr:hypothetical protein AVEN_64527-1 [Araneus ventricosus]